ASKVSLASVLVFFVVFFNAFQGVREVDRNLLANARVLGASRLQIARHVVLPSALTWIIASLHVAFGFAIIGAIVGEFLGAQKGLGLVIASSQNHFNPNGVFAAMVIIALIALTAEGLIGQLQRRLQRGRHQRQLQPADSNDDGRRDRQADLPALPARSEPRLLQEVRSQREALHRAERRRRR